MITWKDLGTREPSVGADNFVNDDTKIASPAKLAVTHLMAFATPHGTANASKAFPETHTRS